MAKGDEPTIPNVPTQDELGGTAQEQFGSAIEAELAALNPRLAAERRFAPEFARVGVEQLETFAPRLAALTQRLNPEAFAAQQLLGERIRGGLETGLDPASEQFFRQQFRAQEGAAGRLGSPVGSLNVARNLTRLRLENQARLEGLLASQAGRTPTLGGGLTGAALGGGPGLTGQFVAPQLQLGASLAGTRAGLFGTQAGIFGERQRAQTARRGQDIGLIGQGIGALSTLGSAFI